MKYQQKNLVLKTQVHLLKDPLSNKPKEQVNRMEWQLLLLYVEKTLFIQLNHHFQVKYLLKIDLMALLKKLADGNYNLVMYNCLEAIE